MKLLHLKDVPKTTAHDNLIRQRFVAPGDLKSKVQTVNYVELQPGESYTPHNHPDCEECFFVIEGEAKAVIAEKTFMFRKGDFLVVEPKEMHVFTNTSQKIFIYFQFRILV
jgi:mannose-6-phosphate isomerase-like protein (cupin superfamily)